MWVHFANGLNTITTDLRPQTTWWSSRGIRGGGGGDLGGSVAVRETAGYRGAIGLLLAGETDVVWRWQVRASSYNSNKLINQIQQFYNLLLDVLFCSTCFGRLHAHHQELTTSLTASGFTLERGGSSVVSIGLADHDQQRSNRHFPTVKPEVASAVVCSWWWADRRPKHVEPQINVK
jgi:hypothetical protein